MDPVAKATVVAEVDDQVLNTVEAAAYIGARPNTLEIWRVTGRYDLPFEKIGRAVRYRRSALDRFRQLRTFHSTGEYAEAAK